MTVDGWCVRLSDVGLMGWMPGAVLRCVFCNLMWCAVGAVVKQAGFLVFARISRVNLFAVWRLAERTGASYKHLT